MVYGDDNYAELVKLSKEIDATLDEKGKETYKEKRNQKNEVLKTHLSPQRLKQRKEQVINRLKVSNKEVANKENKQLGGESKKKLEEVLNVSKTSGVVKKLESRFDEKINSLEEKIFGAIDDLKNVSYCLST